MKRSKIAAMAVGVMAMGAVAVAATIPGVGNVSSNGASTLVSTPTGTVVVTPLRGDIVKVSKIPAGMTNYTYPRSMSAVLEGDASAMSRFVTPTEVMFRSDRMTLSVDRATGRVTYLNAEGDTLLVEAEGVDNRDDSRRASFLNGRAQNFYGAGERGHSLRLNGDTLTMYNRQNYGYTGSDPRISQMGISVPYFASDAGYGVLFDDYARAGLTLGRDSIVYETESRLPLSYYFIEGDGTLPGVVSNYTALTGRQNLPPFWTLGYITSRYGYHNEQEALGAIDSLKQRDIPVDGIVFDLYWYGKETDMGRLEWNREQFPDHRAMLDSLRSMGVNTVLITQPYINKIGAIDNYNTLAEGGMLTRDDEGNPHDVTTWVGEAGMFDISNPKTRAWLWNRLKPLTAEGLAGWWGDLGEPEVHPETIRHANGQTATEYHNVYGNEWSRLIYEGLRRDFPDQRPMLMMRGGTAGLQRYSVFPWTTDVSRSWGGLAPQITLMLNSGLSGLAYMGSDVGGFAVDPAHPYDPELYVRWLQMGTFSPMLRTHAQQQPEPYHYPKQLDIVRKFIKMRYEWLPYNYTLAYENSAQGLPLARPVNFHSESGVDGNNVQDEYLWGSEVLVAPVLTAGAKTRRVTFPSGSRWYNWNEPTRTYAGGSTAVVSAPLQTLPLFVRAGAFIPQYEREIANVEEYDPRYLTVKYFVGSEETSYTLFDDDRKNPESLGEGAYSLTTFTAVPGKGNLSIDIEREGGYVGMPAEREITMQIVGTAKPAAVSVDGKTLAATAWSYAAATRTLTVTLTVGEKATLNIKH